MKKNKTSLYVLFPVVIGIWAYIGWKVYDGIHSEEPVPVLPMAAAVAEDKAAVPDTFAVRMHHRDPFLGKADSRKNENTAAPKIPTPKFQQSKQQALTTEKEWPSIVFGGIMKRRQGPVLAMLNIDGQDYLLRENEKAGNLLLVSVSGDSAVVLQRGRERRVFKNK